MQMVMLFETPYCLWGFELALTSSIPLCCKHFNIVTMQSSIVCGNVIL